MAYDEGTADRIRKVLARRKGITEKKMFGGLAFLVKGHMCCGVNKSVLMLRLGEEGAAEALQEKHASPMDFTGRALKTMVYVDPPAFAAEQDLRQWVDQAVRFCRQLPPR